MDKVLLVCEKVGWSFVILSALSFALSGQIVFLIHAIGNFIVVKLVFPRIKSFLKKEVR